MNECMTGAQKLGSLAFDASLASCDLYRWDISAYVDNMKKQHRLSERIGLVYTMSCNVYSLYIEI